MNDPWMTQYVATKYRTALHEGAGNKFFELLRGSAATDIQVADYLRRLIAKHGLNPEEIAMAQKPVKKILEGDDPETRLKRLFIKEQVKVGDRVYFLPLTGHTQDPERLQIVAKMYERAKKFAQPSPGQEVKPPWALFRLDIEREADNKVDPHAVRVNIWWNRDGVMHQQTMGYLKANHQGQMVGHNRTILSFLADGLVRKIAYRTSDQREKAEKLVCSRVHPVFIRVRPENPTEKPRVLLGIITDASAVHVPEGCVRPETYYRDPEGKVRQGTNGMAVASKAPTPIPDAVPAPSVKSRDWATPKQINELLTLLAPFSRFFSLQNQEDDKMAICLPVVLSQWRHPPRKMTDTEKRDVLTGTTNNRWSENYNEPTDVMDLSSIEKEYGPQMAEVYYQFSGGCTGPMNTTHCQNVIVLLKKIGEATVDFDRMVGHGTTS